MAPDTPTEPAEPGDPAETAESDGAAEAAECDEAAEREAEWQRRRRLAEVFGDTTPDQTSDDRDPREDRSGKGDDWYRDQVPPHHG